MSKVKIVCSDRHAHGNTVTLPIVGDTLVSTDGIAEVPQEVADLLVENGGDNWSYETEKKAEKKDKKDKKDKPEKEPKDDKKKEGKKEGENKKENKQTDEDAAKAQKDALKAELGKLELPDLIKMAKDAKIDEKEYEKFAENKKLMVSFLLKHV